MKLVVFGENIARPSGFGNQTKILANAFADAGIETLLYSANGVSKQEQKFKEFPVVYSDYEIISKLISQHKPDIYVMFGPVGAHDGFFFSEMNKIVKPYIWLAWESIVAQPDMGLRLKALGNNRVVHLSEYARDIWKDYCGVNQPVIPHGVDTSIYKPLDNKTELRKKFTTKFRQFIDPNAYVILSVDRNDPRKRHDFSYDIAERLIKQGHNVQLIMHCQKTGTFDLPKMAKLYNLPEGSVIFTDFDWVAGLSLEEMNELYNLADCRLCCSGGEGFGIPSIEALASGCLNIVPTNTTFPEIIGNNGLLIEAGNRTGSLFPDAVFSDIVVEDAIEKIKWAMKNKSAVDEMTVRGVQSIAGKYDIETVSKRWVDLVCNNEVTQKDITYLYTFGIGQEQKEREEIRDIACIIQATLYGDTLIDIGTKTGLIPHTVNLRKSNAVGYEADINYKDHATETAKLFIQYGGKFDYDFDSFSYSFINSLETMTDEQIDIYMQKSPNRVYFRADSDPFKPGKNKINIKSKKSWIKLFEKYGYIYSKANNEINRKYANLNLTLLVKNGFEIEFCVEDLEKRALQKV